MAEIFNPGETDPLANLRDIHLPTPVDAFPPAPGWWMLGLLAIAMAVVGLYLLFKWWRQNQYRREALAALDQIKMLPASDYVLAYNDLLKRVALTSYPRHEVASLTGVSWVAFLDRTGNTQEFSMGDGQNLIDAPYRQQADINQQALHELAARWIKNHKPLEALA